MINFFNHIDNSRPFLKEIICMKPRDHILCVNILSKLYIINELIKISQKKSAYYLLLSHLSQFFHHYNDNVTFFIFLLYLSFFPAIRTLDAILSMFVFQE